MLFNSIEFVVFFLAVVLLLSVTKDNFRQKIIYLVSSYVFYMWWNWKLIFLIVFFTVFNYLLGKYIRQQADDRRAKQAMAAGIWVNLLLLIFYKYIYFVLGNVNSVLDIFAAEPLALPFDVITPVAISFITFHVISYLVDIYKRKSEPAESMLDFSIYLSFFPHIVAGPIVRPNEFLPAMKTPRRMNFDAEFLLLIYRGLFKKMIIADNLSTFVNLVLDHPDKYPSLIIILAAVAFSIQIYCDFSGYTDMAIGLAGIMGITFPDNFNKPYLSVTPSEFWERWHISLSRWLRDYVYISLGGNRSGKWNTYRNLMITMILGGFWHGASWNFILWGALHGAVLVLYRITGLDEYISRNYAVRLKRGFFWLLFSAYTTLSWLIFRVTDVEKLKICLRKVILFDFDFHFTNVGIGGLNFIVTMLLVTVFILIHFIITGRVKSEKYLSGLPWYTLAILLFLSGMFFYFLTPFNEAPFIYFQF